MKRIFDYKWMVCSVCMYVLGLHVAASAQDASMPYLRFELGIVKSVVVPDTIIDSVAFVSFNAEFPDSVSLPHDLSIPGKVNVEGKSYNVVVAKDAFRNCDWIHEVVMEEGILRIFSNAFSGCSNLHSVSIPQSVDWILPHVFLDTPNLSVIRVAEGNELYNSRENCNAVVTVGGILLVGCKGTTVPSGVHIIEREAFLGCVGLDSIVIPDNVTEISGKAFEGCVNLKKVVLPKNLATLCKNAFAHCTSLEEIYIPASVKRIYCNPFSGCIGLKRIVVDKHNPNYDSRKSCNAIIETKTCRLMTTCMNTVIPSSVKEYEWCFAYMPIKEIHISKNVTYINPFAFLGCSELKYMTVDERNPVYDSRDQCNAVIQKNGDILVAGCYNTRIPSGVSVIGGSAFRERALSPDFEIPYGMKCIMGAAFADCRGLQQVHVPYTVNFMGEDVFSGCHDLQSVRFDAFINEIQPRTFLNCSKLTDINIPYNIRIIGNSAFKGCVMLENIRFERGVEVVDDEAFDDCPFDASQSRIMTDKYKF